VQATTDGGGGKVLEGVRAIHISRQTSNLSLSEMP
jgi:hypothetical protein